MSKHIGVMGRSDFVLGFNLAGVRKTYVVDEAGFPKAIERILSQKDDLGILIVEDQALSTLSPLQRRRVTESLEPVVVAMGEGAGQNDLREKVKRAIGIDIVK
jgi:V/A-type H+-transporting ATPase subunit F